MAKKITSFSLDEDILKLLKTLADKENRSMANMLQILIKEAATKSKVKLHKL